MHFLLIKYEQVLTSWDCKNADAIDKMSLTVRVMVRTCCLQEDTRGAKAS